MVADGTWVTAKRAGWNERLTPVQELDTEPTEYESDDLEGALETHTGALWNGTPVTVTIVGGQEADPATVEPVPIIPLETTEG